MSSETTEEMPAAARPAAAALAPGATRWIQLLLGVLCMMAISSPQYVWTLFTKPISAKLGVSLAELQVTFSILIVLQTFLSPVQGLLVDRFGPKRLLAIGAAFTGASWVLAANAQNLVALYLTGTQALPRDAENDRPDRLIPDPAARSTLLP